MLALRHLLPALLVAVVLPARLASAQSWTADNGNGTYSNPLFYEEFSDPDMIRVGDDFYLTGTTMHSMPGLPVLHSKDLVNWRLVSYALQKLDLGPEYRLEDRKNIYGQGIWAPSFRYHQGTYYIFSNVNRQKTQIFSATSPAGPWRHREMKRSLHDLSVLFDDNGKVYVVWGYRSIRFAELNASLDDVVPGTEREIITEAAGMGEGLHFYKIDGKYFITSAWYAERMRMPAARADKPEGPYEVNLAISIDEDFGLPQGNRLADMWARSRPFVVRPGEASATGKISLHQGGIIQTPLGEWWGYSMMDFNSLGRLTALSPVTWKDGWPYFGLPGNLGRTPRTWIKPKVAAAQQIRAPYVRDDDFSGPSLANAWQWSHVPVDEAWSLEKKRGHLRLIALPAAHLWEARNLLTQRALGPRSSPVAALDGSGLQDGDVAGLALFNRPYAWIGLERRDGQLFLVQFDELTEAAKRKPVAATKVWLRANCDFIAERATFSYSIDGKKFEDFGQPFTMVFQLGTFQGIRYTLFAYNVGGKHGGYADFDDFRVAEIGAHGLSRPIPIGESVSFASVGRDYGLGAQAGRLAVTAPLGFQIRDMKFGRVALQHGRSFVSITAEGVASMAEPEQPGRAEAFQWMETPGGDLVLMSLANHRFLRIAPETRRISADSPGPLPDGSDGARFEWTKAPSPGKVDSPPAGR